MTATLKSADLLAAAGITYRQLDYWSRTGFLGPFEREPLSKTALAARRRQARTRYGSNGSGRDRLYTQENLRRAVVLGAVTRAGIDVRVAADAFDCGFIRTTESGAVVLVLTSGVSVTIDPREIGPEHPETSDPLTDNDSPMPARISA